jgi:hypothetical protein
MRHYIIAAAVAVGLIGLWAAILPLTAEPATEQTAATSPTMSKALVLCRGQNGLDQACWRALANALALDAKVDASTQVTDRRCQAVQTGTRQPGSMRTTPSGCCRSGSPDRLTIR